MCNRGEQPRNSARSDSNSGNSSNYARAFAGRKNTDTRYNHAAQNASSSCLRASFVAGHRVNACIEGFRPLLPRAHSQTHIYAPHFKAILEGRPTTYASRYHLLSPNGHLPCVAAGTQCSELLYGATYLCMTSYYSHEKPRHSAIQAAP